MSTSQQALRRLPEPAPSRWTRFKDALVIPGLLGFTRCGAVYEPQSNRLDGRTAVITGATAGIGLACARQLALLGASVILVARDVQKGQAVAESLKKDVADERERNLAAQSENQFPSSDQLYNNGQSIVVERCDMSLLADVVRLVQRLGPIDILVNNCGVLVPKGEPKQFSQGEHVEMTLATNLLSHFVLTNLVTFRAPIPLANRHDGQPWRPRVVNVSSGGMYSTKAFPDDLSYDVPKEFDGVDAYARTKRAQVILTDLWAERLFKMYGAAVHCMHPGWVDTPGVSHSLPGFYKWTTRLSMLRTPDQGADTITWLAASMDEGANETSGGFWLDRVPHPKHMSDKTIETDAERKCLWNRLAEKAESVLHAYGGVADAELLTSIRFDRLE